MYIVHVAIHTCNCGTQYTTVAFLPLTDALFDLLMKMVVEPVPADKQLAAGVCVCVCVGACTRTFLHFININMYRHEFLSGEA